MWINNRRRGVGAYIPKDTEGSSDKIWNFYRQIGQLVAVMLGGVRVGQIIRVSGNPQTECQKTRYEASTHLVTPRVYFRRHICTTSRTPQRSDLIQALPCRRCIRYFSARQQSFSWIQHGSVTSSVSFVSGMSFLNGGLRLCVPNE